MERLIRGVIQLGGVPDIDDANVNWRALEDADLEYSLVEDAKVFEYLRTFYGSVSAPPEFALVKEYFEKLDEIEVVERLNEIKRAVPYIRTNYLAIIKGEQERQSIKAVVRIAREAAHVAEHGLARGKTVLRGPHQALELFESQSSKLRIGGDEWRFVRPSDMVKPLEPIRQLMSHFRLGEGRPNALVGYAGSAKTFLAIELAIATASGRPCWGGVPLSNGGAVVHLDYEMGSKNLIRRYQRVAAGMNVDLSNLLGTPKASGIREVLQRVVDRHAPGWVDPDSLLQVASFPRTNLHSPNAVHALTKLCKGKALLIIDSFRAATVGSKASENDSEMRFYLDKLAQVSDRTGCVILVLHHSRKTAKDGASANIPPIEQMRGSSGLADALGASVHVQRVDGKGAFRLQQGKTSLGKPGDSLLLRLEDVGDPCEGWMDTTGICVVRVEDDGVDVDGDGTAAIKDPYLDAVRTAVASGAITSVRDLYRACQAVGLANHPKIDAAMRQCGAVKGVDGQYRLPANDDMLM